MRRSKGNPTKSAINSYLRRRRFSEPEHNYQLQSSRCVYSLHQMAIMGVIDKGLTRNNSVSFSNNVASDSRHVEFQFNRLKSWIADLKGDTHRYELETLLCPLFCHLYLEMLCGNHRQSASKFFERHQALFSPRENCRKLLEELSCVFSSQDIKSSAFVRSFRSSKYQLRLSSDALIMLQRYLSDHGHLLILQVLQKWFDIDIDMFTLKKRDHESEMEGRITIAAKTKEYPICKIKTERSDGRINHTYECKSLPNKMQMWLEKEQNTNFIDSKNFLSLGNNFKHIIKKEENFNCHRIKEEKKDKTYNCTGGDSSVQKKVQKWFDGEFKNDIKIEKGETILEPTIKTVDKEREIQSVKIKEPKNEPPGNESKVQDLNIKLTKEEKAEKLKNVLDVIRAVKEKPTSNPVLLYAICNAQDNGRIACAKVNGPVSFLSAGINNNVKLWGLAHKLKQRSSLPCTYLRTTSTRTSRTRRRGPHSSHSEDSNVVTLFGHSGPVQDVAFVPAVGSLGVIVSVSQDATMRCWRLDNYRNAAAYRGHNHEIWCVDASSLGMYIGTGSRDRTARVWSLERNYPLRTCCGHLLDVECIKFHPNNLYFATGSADKTVKMWSVNDAKLLRSFPGHTDAIRALAFSPDGKYLASAAEDGIKFWDLAAGKDIKEYEVRADPVFSLSWSKSNEFLSSCSTDGTIKLWNLHKRGVSSENVPVKPTQTYSMSRGVISLQYSSNNTIVCVAIS